VIERVGKSPRHGGVLGITGDHEKQQKELQNTANPSIENIRRGGGTEGVEFTAGSKKGRGEGKKGKKKFVGSESCKTRKGYAGGEGKSE